MQLKGRNNKSYADPIYANELAANLDHYKILDIRKEDDFKKAHVKGAVNIRHKDQMREYIEANPDSKIVFQCYTGHGAANYGSAFVEEGFSGIYFFDEKFEELEKAGLALEQMP